MAIVVTHTKVSTIPDGDDSSLIRPSDWNDTHTLTGLGTMAEQNANAVAITGGTISGVTLPASNITGILGVPNGGTGAATLTGYVKGTGITAMTASATIPNTDITGLGTASTKDAGVALGVATLDAGGKVPASQIPLQGDLNYQGTWNATTNSPTLTSSVGTKGYYYVVDVAGTTNLDGITDWQVGDWAIFNGSVWQKVDNTDSVTSVNGQVGTVVLTTTNIAEGTNLYYTDARARASISAGTGISYDNGTGVVTNSAPDQVVALTGAGTTSITGTYPNFTITSNDEFDGDVVGPASATDNAIARFNTTTGKLIQNSTVTIDDNGNTNLNAVTFDITPATLPTAEGSLYWDADDSAKTLSLVMTGGNAIQQIGEETYIRIKASATITEGQVIMFTGTLGGSGVLLGAPATGLTASTAQYVMGVATEDIANNSFGYVTTFGLVRGIDTSGGAESWVDGDLLYLNPAVAGGLTKTLPTAPNPKVQVCAVVNASPGASGSLFIRPSFGGILGQYEGDVQVTTPANGQLLIRDQTAGRWINATLTDGTAISITEGAGSVTITNTAPDQVVTLTQGGTTTITGTYPNFTISSDDQYDGTVTSVGGTGTVNGLTLTGTVTTSGNLTLGGTLDLSAPPVIGNTTPNLITGTTITATTYVGISGGTF